MPGPRIEEFVEADFAKRFGYAALQRVRVESGTSRDDLMLRCDVRFVRNAGPLNRVLTDYLAPGDLRGNRMLLIENSPSHYECFVWVKALRKVRRLPIVRNDPVLGTGLVLEDFLSLRLEDWEAKLLHEDERTREIELKPRGFFESAYEKIVGTYRNQQEPDLLSLDYFSGGRKLKTLRIDSVVDKGTPARPGPFVVVTSVEGPGRLITVMNAEIEPLASVREGLFSAASLERSVSIGGKSGRI